MELGHSRSTGVHAVDFHGDGGQMNGNVDIVNTERPLVVGNCAHLSEVLDNLKLEHADPVVSPALGPLAFGLESINAPSPRGVGFLRSFFAKLRGVLGCAQNRSFGHVAPFKAKLLEAPVDLNPRYSGFFAQCKDAFARKVLGM